MSEFLVQWPLCRNPISKKKKKSKKKKNQNPRFQTLNLPRIRAKEQMKVKENQNFMLKTSKVAHQVKRNTNGFKTQNVPKHESLGLLLPESMGLLPCCPCTNKTQSILNFEWMSKRERECVGEE